MSAEFAGEPVDHLNLIGAGPWRLLDDNCIFVEANYLLHMDFQDVAPNGTDRDTDLPVRDPVGWRLLIQPATAGPS